MSNSRLAQNSINEYFAWLEQALRPGSDLQELAHGYLENEREKYMRGEHEGPFLSIIMRTQGKRPEMLREALLCLSGQCDPDFELLLMGHNLTEEDKLSVERQIDELPESMRRKTRLIVVHGGTRTTPLNRGFEAARGQYIAVFDDDDLVLDNWVSVFRGLSEQKPGAVLHAYCVQQDWETLGGDHPNVPRAVGSLDNTCCRNYHFLEQLVVNHCPLLSLAFPSYVFQDWGIRFDETLTTTEDWDYLLRCAALCGVVDAKIPTQIYRIWKNAETSATVHGESEWDKNYRKIVRRTVSTPMIIPSNALHGVVDKDKKGTDEISNEMQLLYDEGTGFADGKELVFNRAEEKDEFDFFYAPAEDDNGQPAELPPIKRIRFDPQPLGYLTVTDLLIRVKETDGSFTDYTIDDIQSNGYIPNDTRIIFWRNDPQIILPFDSPKLISKVFIRCALNHVISDADMDAVSFGIGDEMKFYYDEGSGYSEECTLKRDQTYYDDNYDARFIARAGAVSVRGVRSLRFDPDYYGLLTASGLKIRVEEENGTVTHYTAADATTNGYLLENERFVFLKTDPQIILSFPEPKDISRVWVRCELKKSISDEDLDAIRPSVAAEYRSDKFKCSLFYRGLRKLYHLVKKVFGMK